MFGNGVGSSCLNISAVSLDKHAKFFEYRLFSISQCCMALLGIKCSGATSSGSIVSRVVLVKWVLRL